MTETSERESEVTNQLADIGKKYVRALFLSLHYMIQQLERKPATQPVARHSTSLLHPKQQVYVQKMTARQKREVLGAILMLMGGVLIVVGLTYHVLQRKADTTHGQDCSNDSLRSNGLRNWRNCHRVHSLRNRTWSVPCKEP